MATVHSYLDDFHNSDMGVEERKPYLRIIGERLISRATILIQDECSAEDICRLIRLLEESVSLTGKNVIPGFEHTLFHALRTLKKRVGQIYTPACRLLE